MLLAGEYTITRARWSDLARLAAIELAAAKLLAGHAPESVLAQATSLSELQEAYSRGHLWVALIEGLPIGFAHIEVLEPETAHLKEIDVHPEHGRRGIGARLVTAVCDWATSAGHEAVTLTTFRDVRWNMPFYAKLGFIEIELEDLSRALRSVVDEETRRGLDPAHRVVMRRRCSPAQDAMPEE